MTALAPTVCRARDGSRDALEALVREYQDPLHGLCYRFVRDHDAAADLVQRTLIKAMESLPELRDPDFFRGWLFRIAMNLSLNHLREHNRFVRHISPEGHAAPEAEQAIQAADQSRVLLRAVARLPPRQRQVVELRLYRELPFNDIAVELRTSANAAKVSYHHAVKKLRRLVGDGAGGR
jgi:RNA polymerase sigma-70 factor (ECF subfamily)